MSAAALKNHLITIQFNLYNHVFRLTSNACINMTDIPCSAPHMTHLL